MTASDTHRGLEYTMMSLNAWKKRSSFLTPSLEVMRKSFPAWIKRRPRWKISTLPTKSFWIAKSCGVMGGGTDQGLRERLRIIGRVTFAVEDEYLHLSCTLLRRVIHAQRRRLKNTHSLLQCHPRTLESR